VPWWCLPQSLSSVFYLLGWLPWKVRIFSKTLTAGSSLSHSIRTLLASIKFLAQCPCPRCLIPKIKIGNLRSRTDRRWHEEKIREDGHRIWSIIRQVREWLYVKGTNITSIFVKRMLAPESLVPSMVCCIYYILFTLLIYLECLLNLAHTLWVQLLHYVCPWSASWIRTGSLESNFYSSHPCSLRIWPWHNTTE
jgi:hypothetical protein